MESLEPFSGVFGKKNGGPMMGSRPLLGDWAGRCWVRGLGRRIKSPTIPGSGWWPRDRAHPPRIAVRRVELREAAFPATCGRAGPPEGGENVSAWWPDLRAAFGVTSPQLLAAWDPNHAGLSTLVANPQMRQTPCAQTHRRDAGPMGPLGAQIRAMYALNHSQGSARCVRFGRLPAAGPEAISSMHWRVGACAHDAPFAQLFWAI